MTKNTIPQIHVGIMTDQQISFRLKGVFHDARNDHLTGEWRVWCENDALYLSNQIRAFQIEEGFTIQPDVEEKCAIRLRNVTIGIGFHWERKEDQVFKGGLKFVTENSMVRIINILSIEDYLKSVISSEMSATSSLELLKAHAVSSRSWLLAQIEKSKMVSRSGSCYETVIRTEKEYTKWYDREDHDQFDVCADDHCQRYQGITRSSTALVDQAVSETMGELLVHQNKICDARFSKCCGGITESFEHVWEPTNHPYLQSLVDNDRNPPGFDLVVDSESAARSWILGNPEAFCHTNDRAVLAQVLNDYDQETNDFYRWELRISQENLGLLIQRRIGLDFGTVLDLIPVERGGSGRLTKLKIVGSKMTMTIGKELEIRKALSESHLYSSAIVFDKEVTNGTTTFIINGAGWGHGVGLCQIGAAVMGNRGYTYSQILAHYFKGAHIEKKY
jgi:stage II sporulation protein D